MSGRCSASWITAAATPRITSTSRELALDVIAAVLTGGNRWEGLLMPPAELAWLDHSQADQRRAREIVALFSQRESRDEQGLGGVRDALSDTLFPGTSVLLTRARYLLFVTWLFREGGRRRHVGPQLVRWVERQERRLIGWRLARGWRPRWLDRTKRGACRPKSSLQRLLEQPAKLRNLAPRRNHGPSRGSSSDHERPDDVTEFIERSDAVWAPSIPAPPDDFFSLTLCDFALTHDEATWLAERIVDAAPETLLQHLVASGNRASPSAGFVWEDPEAAAATGRICGALNEARRFALLVHEAMLLYNLLLAERADELGLTEHDGLRDAFSTQLSDWRDEAEACDLGAWDLERLWTLVAEQGRPVAAPTR